MEPKRAAFLPTAFVAVAIDQATKVVTMESLDSGAREAIFGGWLAWTNVPAMGGALGFFRDWIPAAQLVGFAVLALVTFGIIAHFYRTLAPGERGCAAGLGAMLGGITAHAIDRLRFGAGLDILHLGPLHSNAIPDFSLADVAIVLGVVTLIVELLATEFTTRASERPRL